MKNISYFMSDVQDSNQINSSGEFNIEGGQVYIYQNDCDSHSEQKTTAFPIQEFSNDSKRLKSIMAQSERISTENLPKKRQEKRQLQGVQKKAASKDIPKNILSKKITKEQPRPGNTLPSNLAKIVIKSIHQSFGRDSQIRDNLNRFIEKYEINSQVWSFDGLMLYFKYLYPNAQQLQKFERQFTIRINKKLKRLIAKQTKTKISQGQSMLIVKSYNSRFFSYLNRNIDIQIDSQTINFLKKIIKKKQTQLKKATNQLKLIIEDLKLQQP